MKIGLVSRLMLGTSLAVFGAGAALAQDDNGNDDGVIIVTAQKREQNLQDVPLAISAIGSEKLEQLQVADARDVSGLAPNVTIVGGTTSNSAAVFSMRGITNSGSETFGLDNANGLYVDGVYIARSASAGLDVTDIERVEVLRGPQGTLFGRNTTGGAISFISRKPSDKFGLKMEAGYGNYNAMNGKATIDTGLVADLFKATFSYSHRERDGVVDNILEPDKSRDPGSRKSDSFRGAIRFEPSDTGYFQYIFDWSEIKGNPNPFQLIAVADATPRPPITVNGVAIAQTQQAPVAQYLAGAVFADPNCKALATPTRAYRDTLCLNSDEISTDKVWGHNFQAGNDFGSFAVKFTAGYRHWENQYSGNDLDGIGVVTGSLFSSASLLNGMPASLLNFVLPASQRPFAPFIAATPVPKTSADLFVSSNDRRHNQFSTELEVSGDTDTLDWVAGAFYFWEKGNENNPQTSGYALDTNGVFIGNFGPLGPSFAAANPARYRLVVTPAKLIYRASAQSTALYSQFTLYPGGRDSGFSLTAGGRYTWDIKNMTRTQNGAAPLTLAEHGDANFSKFTWNLMARYEMSQDVSVYARAATGYRSGGFNASDPVVAGSNIIPSFDSEKVTSYEIGLKSQLFDRRLRFNLAGYYNTYDNLAVTQPVLTGSGTFQSRINNAGKVDYAGVEADFSAQLTDIFSVDGSMGYVDVKYKEFIAGQPVVNTNPVQDISAFARPGYTSPFTSNIALNAAFPLSDSGTELRLRVGYTHEDGKYSFNNAISSPFNEQIKGDSADLVDAQLVVDKIPMGGGEARLMIWGKNITNDHNLVRGIDFGPLGYAGGYFNDPATYGATVGFKF